MNYKYNSGGGLFGTKLELWHSTNSSTTAINQTGNDPGFYFDGLKIVQY